MKLIPKWKQKKKVVTRLDRLINRYEKYLTLERGLAKNTIKLRKKEAYSFLLKAVGTQTNLKRLSPKIIRSYILSKDENGKKKGTAIQSVTCLRSLLRFLFIKNLIQVDLSLATPSIAGWNLRTLPRSLDPIIIEKIVSSCDFSNSSGYRDYAILLLLTQLGLRAGEVAGLRLDSICWREGVIFIAGKGNRTDSLPLPKKIGKTIATYLKDYRYQTKSRRIFLSERAPVGREINTACINRIVKKACKRAGVPEFATHQLRHTVATEILRKGGTLTEIAQVLRHSGVGTTAIYAKVDRVALQSIARKWPGGAK